ncbi:hypothetical protein [Bacillus sp. FJAT-29814]|uniref:DUF7305 domain-containing protein n=1 Tax=Bacillus sp. FJAT-29814 TaxID=1729688 RepID=UPI00083461F6|nr:hypothetical protein [Bacillus sp. FJAT-29814]
MKEYLSLLKRKNNQQGVALVIVLVVLVVVSILCLSITAFAANNMKWSSIERKNQSTYYIAESGITYKMNEIQRTISGLTPGSNMNQYFTNAEVLLKLDQLVSIPGGIFEDSFGQSPIGKVKITKASTYNSNSNTRNYLMTSIGAIDNQSRTVEKPFSITWSSGANVKGILNAGVFANEKIEMPDGGPTINGDVGTNSSKTNSIVLGGAANITGNIYVGPNSKSDVVSNSTSNRIKTPVPVPETKFIMPDFPASNPIGVNKASINQSSGTTPITMDQNFYYSSITLAKGATLNINIGNVDRSIVVDQLDLPYGIINIIGTGKLKIYVNNQFTMSSSSRINSEDKTNQLEIFYRGTNSINVGGNTKVYGSLFVQKADVNITNGAGFQGHIVSLGKNLTFSGGTVVNIRMVYAPNATISFSNGANLSGAVIANTVRVSGASVINYGMPNIDDLSFFETSGQNATVNIESTLAVREK